MIDDVERTELLLRVFCDHVPDEGVEGAYLYAHTLDNERSVIGVARHLLDHGLAKRILISGCGPLCGYPGAEDWTEKLTAAGVASDAIARVPVPADLETMHTLSEAEFFVRFAKERGLRSAIIVSAPFHLERAYMTMVTVATRAYPDLRLHAAPGDPLPWDEEVVHSQGVLRAKRQELIAEELKRIERYQAKSDLLSHAAVLAYMRARDG
jgi:hypothetical protein